MLKQAGNRELKSTTHNTRKGWRVHLNAFFRRSFFNSCFTLFRCRQGLKKVGCNSPFWLTVADKAFNLFSV